MTEYYLGIDLGTGSCKTSLIDQTGKVIAIGSGKYLSSSPGSHWKEQQPDSILDGMISAVKNVIAKANQPAANIKAVSIGSALHGIMAVDQAGNPLTNVYTWADDRAAPQAQVIRQSEWFDELYQQTGCPSHGMYPLYKIIWLRENKPEIFEEAAKYISVKEYILAKLCGEYVIDYAVASGTGLLNIHTHQWNPNSLELAKITPEQLSSPVSPRHTLKITNHALAEKLSIPANTQIIVGASDAANSNLGAGATDAHQATCMIGTSGAYRIISPRPLLHPNTSSWCYCVDEDHWLVGGAINNGGLALSWLRDTLQGTAENEITFNDLLEYAEKSEIGAEGVFCLPFFAGERSPNWNLDARAAFLGLSISHDIRHMARAVVEGIAYRLRSLDEILFEMDNQIEEVRASGGFTQSKFWVQLVTDVLGRPISVLEEGETSCLGAAFWAYLGAAPSAALADLGEWTSIRKTYTPSQNAHTRYSKLYSLFKELYGAISPKFEKMRELHQTLKN